MGCKEVKYSWVLRFWPGRLIIRDISIKHIIVDNHLITYFLVVLKLIVFTLNMFVGYLATTDHIGKYIFISRGQYLGQRDTVLVSETIIFHPQLFMTILASVRCWFPTWCCSFSLLSFRVVTFGRILLLTTPTPHPTHKRDKKTLFSLSNPWSLSTTSISGHASLLPLVLGHIYCMVFHYLCSPVFEPQERKVQEMCTGKPRWKMNSNR